MKAQARRRLYDTAIRLFRERGFDDTTVEAITDLADTAKGTFFNYFPTKEHVLVAYHGEMMDRLMVRLRGLPAVPVEEVIQRGMGMCADWVEADRAMGRIIVSKVFGNAGLLMADREGAQRFAEWFAVQVERGVASGELRSDVDRPAFLSMLAAVPSSTFNAWVVDPEEFDLRDMLERKTRLLFDATRARSREGR